MSKRMTITRYVPPPPAQPSDGLPPMPDLPPRDGVYEWRFIGRKSLADAWSSESMVRYAKQYARTCAVALDLEMDVLRTENGAMKAELERLRGG